MLNRLSTLLKVLRNPSLLNKAVSGAGFSFSVPDAYTMASYGPGQPIPPLPYGEDVEIPRSIDYPIAVNSMLTPRTGYNLISFPTIFAAYENIPECKSPVSLIRREMSNFKPHLVDEDGNEVTDHDYQWMCEYPDGSTPWSVFLTWFLTNAKVYDAPALYIQREHGTTKALHYIDGSTLFLIIDQFGKRPKPESVYDYVSRVSGSTIPQSIAPVSKATMGPTSLQAFLQQYEQRRRSGLSVPDKVPAFTQVIHGTPFSWWSSDDIWYQPQSPRMNAPYGECFIESTWIWVMILANIESFELAHYRVGNMPEGYITLPKEWLAGIDALDAVERTINARMTSNPATQRNRLRFLPDGSKWFQTKKADFPDKLYNQAFANVLHAIGIPKSEFGDIPGGGLGGKGFKEGSETDLSRNTLDPHRAFVAAPFNAILKADGVKDVRFELAYDITETDPAKKEESISQGMIRGTLSLNEALAELGRPTVGNPSDPNNIANKHWIVAGTAIYVIEDMQTQGGMAVPSFTGKPGGNSGGAPAGPETAVQQHGGEHTPQDHATLQQAIQNVHERGTLDSKFHSIPSGKVFKTAADTSVKVSKSSVQYTDQAANARERCQLCRHYQGNGVCGLVEGTVSPDGWCKLFEPGASKMLDKHCGVCEDDDQYYKAPVSREVTMLFPNTNHANDVEIVAMVPEGLPPKPALWKPEGGEVEGLQDFIGGAQYVREEAAYLLDRSLGFMLVPVAYTAAVDDEVGAAIMYSFNALPPLADVSQYDPLWVLKAGILDCIMAQTDRGMDHNYLTHPDEPQRPILIDNGLGFPTAKEAYTHSPFYYAVEGQPVTPDLMTCLKLCQGDFTTWENIRALIGDEATQAALFRLQRLIDTGIVSDQMVISKRLDKAKALTVARITDEELAQVGALHRRMLSNMDKTDG